jgi:hypothetical protein
MSKASFNHQPSIIYRLFIHLCWFKPLNNDGCTCKKNSNHQPVANHSAKKMSTTTAAFVITAIPGVVGLEESWWMSHGENKTSSSANPGLLSMKS